MKRLFSKVGIILLSMLLIISIQASASINDVQKNKNPSNRNTSVSYDKIAIEEDEANEYERISELLENEIVERRNEVKEFERISDLLKNEIVESRNEVKEFERTSKLLENEIAQKRDGVTGVEPVGKSKHVNVYLYVPYDSNVNEKYFYNDEYYSGWIPVRYQAVTNIDGNSFWYVVYSGEVYYKGAL